MKLKFKRPIEILTDLRFLFPPILTLILGKLLFELFAFQFPDLNDALIQNISEYAPQSSAEIKFSESKARLLWMTSVMVYFFVCAGFVVFIWHTLRRSVTAGKRLLFLSIATLFSISEIVYLSLIADSSNSPLVAIFNFSYDALVESSLYAKQELLSIKNTLIAINLVAVLVTPFGIITGCCIMLKTPVQEMSRLHFLRSQSEDLKDLLIGGSAVMVIGLVHMKLWLSWPLSLVNDSELLDQLEVITLTVSQYWGVTYTLIIAALYMPAAIHLTQEAKKTIMLGNDEALKNNPGQWLSENKMQISPTSQLPQLVTILSPMLVGSFGTSLSNLVQF